MLKQWRMQCVFFFFYFFPRFITYAYTKSCFDCKLSKLFKISKTQKENSNQNVRKKNSQGCEPFNLRQLDLGVVCDWARLHETRRCGEMGLGFRGNKDEKLDFVGLGRWASTKSRRKKKQK